jgi:hypothetical protein
MLGVDEALRARAGDARWSPADLVLLDEIADLLDRTPASATSSSTKRRTSRRCSCAPWAAAARPARRPSSATSPRGPLRGPRVPGRSHLEHLGKPEAVVEVLDRGFRVPAAVIAYAARLLPHMAPGLGVPESVRDHPGDLVIEHVDDRDLHGEAIVTAVRAAMPSQGSVGVIAADSSVALLSKALSRNGSITARSVLTTATSSTRSTSSPPPWPKVWSSTESSSSSRAPSPPPSPTSGPGCVGSMSP